MRQNAAADAVADLLAIWRLIVTGVEVGISAFIAGVYPPESPSCVLWLCCNDQFRFLSRSAVPLRVVLFTVASCLRVFSI